MLHIPKKLLALAAPLAIVVGLALPSMAFAGVASESLPSTAKANWTAVTTKCGTVETPAEGCEFVATSTHSVLTNGEAAVANCEVILDGKIFANGSSKITAGKVNGNAICRAIKLEELPWNNQICDYVGSGSNSYYDRISINFFEALGQKIPGPIYVHLLNSSKADASPLKVSFASARKFANALKPAEIREGPWGILADDESSSTMYSFGATPEITVTGTGVSSSCLWNFEKLNELP